MGYHCDKYARLYFCYYAHLITHCLSLFHLPSQPNIAQPILSVHLICVFVIQRTIPQPSEAMPQQFTVLSPILCLGFHQLHNPRSCWSMYQPDTTTIPLSQYHLCFEQTMSIQSAYAVNNLLPFEFYSTVYWDSKIGWPELLGWHLGMRYLSRFFCLLGLSETISCFVSKLGRKYCI